MKIEVFCAVLFSWGRKLGYSCCFHCMRALEEPDQCIARLTQGQITHLPENDWSAQGFKKIVPIVSVSNFNTSVFSRCVLGFQKLYQKTRILGVRYNFAKNS